MRDIDYKALLFNVEEMINVCEYDSMRSAGKTKINADTLVNLYALKERYSAAKAKPATKKKEA